jgi:hypothetical protein
MTNLPDLKYPCGCKITFHDGTVTVYKVCLKHIRENKK